MQSREEWSTPDGSKITPSYAQRMGRSTFQTSFPRLCPAGAPAPTTSHGGNSVYLGTVTAAASDSEHDRRARA